MLLRNCISVIVLMAVLLNVHVLATTATATKPVVAEEDIGDDPRVHGVICSKHKHLPLSKFTCCNGTALTNWINEKSWSDCQSVVSTGDENLYDSIWRVFTCVLSKSLGIDRKTISLVEFTNIMIAHYPEKIKESIGGSIKELGSKSTAETNNWLTSDVSLTDLSNLNKIRAQYYNVEKQVCTDEKVEIISSDSLHPCNTTEEFLHRFGGCCTNGSAPFRFYANSPSNRLNLVTTCNKTMERMFAKFSKDDKTQRLLPHMCRYPCYLVENSFLTMDEVLKLRQASDIPPMKIIINSTYPYFPVKTRTYLETILTRSYNGTQMFEYTKNAIVRLNLTNASPEDLYACVALNSFHTWLANMRC